MSFSVMCYALDLQTNTWWLYVARPCSAHISSHHPLAHSAPVTPVSLLFHHHVEHMSTSVTLHIVFSLFGLFYSKCHTAHFHTSVYWGSLLLDRPSLTGLFKAVRPQLCPFLLLYFSYLLLQFTGYIIIFIVIISLYCLSLKAGTYFLLLYPSS